MSKETKYQKELNKVLKTYESITLDLEESMDENNQAKHDLEINYNVKRLELNNDRMAELLVSGSGTGDK